MNSDCLDNILKDSIIDSPFISLFEAFNNYLSESTRKIMCNKVYYTVERFCGGEFERDTDYYVEFIGFTFLIDDITKFEDILLNAIKKLADLINYCVEREYIFYGFLLPCCYRHVIDNKYLILSYPLSKLEKGELSKVLINDDKMPKNSIIIK